MQDELEAANINDAAKVSGGYDASNIQVLEGMEAVRKRPAMYIGDTFERGYHHCVYEVVDNSIDEAMAGYCKHIDIRLNADGSCTVKDDGRGIPVDMHKTEHKPAVEVVMTVLHAGGKFGGGGYKVSGGLHGVGVSCVNALSDWLEVEVRRSGKIHRMRFSRGQVTQPLTIVGDTEETGTTVTFHLDREIFHDEAGNGYTFQWDILSKRLKELSFLNPGVVIRFSEESSGKHEEYVHEDGIRGYVRVLNAGRNCITPDVIYMNGERDGVVAEIAMQYVAEKYDESVYTFANNINTHEGGTHLSGFCTALTVAVKDRLRSQFAEKGKGKKGVEKGKGKKGGESDIDDLSGEDIREGLSCIISVKVPDPQFEGQTKTKLGNSNVAGIVRSLVEKKLKEYFEENPKIAQTITEKALNSKAARDAARQARERIRKETSGKINFAGKLADCTSRDPSVRELFLVEGDSAGGSAKTGRDRTTQAILPLRGKVLNVHKVRDQRMLENKEILSLITAIGGGFGNPDPSKPADDPANLAAFDVSKIKYDKVIIMTDADVDGAHIRTLLLTFFYKQMRPLITHGHVYLAQPPLYGLKRGNKMLEYIESDAMLTKKLVSLGSEDFNYTSSDGANVINGSEMPELLAILSSAEDLCTRLSKQNVDVKRFFELRDATTGEFPRYRVITDIDGNPEDHYVFKFDEAEALKAKTAAELGCEIAVLDEPENPNYTCTEILQADTLRRQMDTLHEVYHFACGDFYDAGREIGVLTDKSGRTYPVTSLMSFLNTIRDRGRKGLTIQRYKGLGEMDADQLADTTMKKGNRKMRRVVFDSRTDADVMFDTLMGEDVERRRKFIEDHALMANVDA